MILNAIGLDIGRISSPKLSGSAGIQDLELFAKSQTLVGLRLGSRSRSNLLN
jgi:hypothetical protein